MNQTPIHPTGTDAPTMLNIRKYPNRRYYDTTRSCHASIEQIHKLIVDGYNVRIVDAQTEEDITSKVLTRILLDYEPGKVGLFSADLLLRAIRVNDQLLRDFVNVYFSQAFEAFCGSQRHFEDLLREAHQLTSTFTQPANWVRPFLPPWSLYGLPTGQQAPYFQAPTTQPSQSDAGTVSSSGERDEVAALQKEIAALKARLNKKGTVARKRRKT